MFERIKKLYFEGRLDEKAVIAAQHNGFISEEEVTKILNDGEE